MFYRNLQEITGHESGAVVYSGGGIWIGNWAGIEGTPRTFALGTIGLSEPLQAKRVAAPKDVIKVMREHARELSGEDHKTGYRAWLVNEDTIVVIQKEWA